jgi:hypothetical protein
MTNLLARIFGSLAIQFWYLHDVIRAINGDRSWPDLNTYVLVSEYGRSEYSGTECMITAIAAEILVVSLIVILTRKLSPAPRTLEIL